LVIYQESLHDARSTKYKMLEDTSLLESWRVNSWRVYTFRVTSRLASIFSDTLLKTSNSASYHLTGSMFEIYYSSRGICRQPWNSVASALYLLAPSHLPCQLIYVSAGLYMWAHEVEGTVVSASTDLKGYYQHHKFRVFILRCRDFW